MQRQRLGRYVEAQRAPVDRDDRQAAAVDRDAVADRDVAEIQRSGVDARAARRRRGAWRRTMRPTACDDAGEHQRSLAKCRDDAPVLAHARRCRAAGRGCDRPGERMLRWQLQHAARGIAEQARREVDAAARRRAAAASSAPLSRAPASTCSSLMPRWPSTSIIARKIDASVAVGQDASPRHCRPVRSVRAVAVTTSVFAVASTRAVARQLAVPIDHDLERLPRVVSTSRTVSCGSSCRTVPMPVRIAHARARQR